MKPFIGIKRVLYGDPMTALPGESGKFDGAALAAMLAKVGTDDAPLTEVKNLHKDTWGYEESDPTVTEYINHHRSAILPRHGAGRNPDCELYPRRICAGGQSSSARWRGD